MHLTHLPDDVFFAVHHPTAENPLRVLVSGCMAGTPRGVDGTTYGAWPPILAELMKLDNVYVVSFCLEELVLHST